jgi:hypothetical protein
MVGFEVLCAFIGKGNGEVLELGLLKKRILQMLQDAVARPFSTYISCSEVRAPRPTM